jgi:UDP-glucose:(heptosyl)LPS alpha-1,3-glucosyltransferase
LNSSIPPPQQKLKIAILVRRFITTGGAERYAVEVTRRLAKNHNVHVFAQEWSSDEKTGVTFHKIPKFLGKPSFLNQLLFSYFTRRFLDGSFDIIHSHERVTQFDVLTIHCPCYRGFITDQKKLWGKMKVWLSVATSPRHLAYLWLEKKQFIYRKKRLLIAVSDNVKRDVQTNYDLPDECFRLAYPGVNADEFSAATTSRYRNQQRSQLGISKDAVVILFVGTEFKRKGLDTLLKAYSLLSTSNTRMLVAGGGSPRTYIQLAQKLGIADSVTFLGLVADVKPLYAISDIYVLPTLSDPSPMAPIEAMASGVATITSCAKFAGSSEQVKNEEALMLNNPKDPREIANALRILMNENHRAKLAEKGRQLAKNLTWQRTTAATLSTYYEVLQLKAMYRST